MKKTTLISIVCILTMLACGKAKQVDEMDPNRKNMTPVESFNQGIAAYNGQDLAVVMTMFGKDIKWSNRNAANLTLKGRPDLARHLMNERNVFPDSAMGIEHIIQEGNTLAVQGVMRATHQGSIPLIAATGKKVAYNFIYFIDMKDGLIMKNMAYFNPVSMLRQIGAVPDSSPPLAQWPEGTATVEKKPKDEKTAATANRFIDLLKSGDNTQIASVLADGFVINDRAKIQTYSSTEEINSFFQSIRKGFNKFKIETKKTVTAGPMIAMSVFLGGDFKLQLEKQTIEREIVLDWAFVLTMEGNKIKSLDVYYDESQIFVRCGISVRNAIGMIGKKKEDKAEPPKVEVSTDSAEETASDTDAKAEAKAI